MQRPGNIRHRFDVSSSMYPFELGKSNNQPGKIRPGAPNQPSPSMGTAQVKRKSTDFVDTDFGHNFVNFHEEVKQATTTTTTALLGQALIQNNAMAALTPQQPTVSNRTLKKMRFNQSVFIKKLGLQPPIRIPKKDPPRDPGTPRGSVDGSLGRTQYKSAFKRMRPYLDKEGITHQSESKAYCELCKREFDPRKHDGTNNDLHVGDFVHLMNLLKFNFPEEVSKFQAAFDTAMEPSCDLTKRVQVKRQLLMAVQEKTKEIRHEHDAQEGAKGDKGAGQEGGGTDLKADAQNAPAPEVNKPASATGVQKTEIPLKPDGQAGKTTSNTFSKPGQSPQQSPQGKPNQVRPQGLPNQVRPQGKPNQVRPQGIPNQVRPQGKPNQFQPRPTLMRPGIRPMRPRPQMNAGIRGKHPLPMPPQPPNWPNFPLQQQLGMNIRQLLGNFALGVNRPNSSVTQRLRLRAPLPSQQRQQNNETSSAGNNRAGSQGNLPGGPVINRLRNLASSGSGEMSRNNNERRQEGPPQFHDQPYDEWHNPRHLNTSEHENHHRGPFSNAPPQLMSLNASKGPDIAGKRNALLMTLNQLGDAVITNKEEADMATRISFSLNKALIAYYKRQGGNNS